MGKTKLETDKMETDLNTKKKTRAQLERENRELERQRQERDDADRKQSEILAAWARQDPDGTRY